MYDQLLADLQDFLCQITYWRKGFEGSPDLNGEASSGNLTGSLSN
jgi:hypothetical protein